MNETTVKSDIGTQRIGDGRGSQVTSRGATQLPHQLIKDSIADEICTPNIITQSHPNSKLSVIQIKTGNTDTVQTPMDKPNILMKV